MRKFLTLFAIIGLTASLSPARADTITIVGPNRTGSLTDAVAGASGLNNPDATAIHNAFGGTWTSVGNFAGSGSNGGTDGMITVSLTSGTWGQGNVTGTFTISSSFWSNYTDAVISMHVGNGGGDPDFFAWTLTPGEMQGTWSYTIDSGTGGGLSNLRLWGGNNSVPDAASTLLLVGGSFAALAFLRRRQK